MHLLTPFDPFGPRSMKESEPDSNSRGPLTEIFIVFPSAVQICFLT